MYDMSLDSYSLPASSSAILSISGSHCSSLLKYILHYISLFFQSNSSHAILPIASADATT